MADRFTNNCTPDYTMTDFISEFNKFNIHNITIDEYNEYQTEHSRHGFRENFVEFLRIERDTGFVIYEDLYFQYSKSEIRRLFEFMENPFDKRFNDSVRYMLHEWRKYSSGKMIIDENQCMVENIIIPKYYEELQKIQKNNEIVKKEEKPVKTKETSVKNEKTKKKPIPLALKRNVWNKHIGETVGKTLCLCCKLTDITQMNFSCGHIISEFNGGNIKLDNLKPICVSCNSSMGTKNMDEFITDCGL